MQGATHRAGGVTAALVGYYLLHRNGVSLVTDYPLASAILLYPYALWGSTASDLDHSPGSLWDEIKLVGKRSGHTLPSQDPISRGISHILHLGSKPRKHLPKSSALYSVLGVCDCKHRSWQTHSELPLALGVGSLYWITNQLPISFTSGVLLLMITGITLGILVHLVLDLLTPEGLPFATGMFFNKFILSKKVFPERIKVVPHIPPKRDAQGNPLGPGFFSTGGTWEKKIIFNLLHLINLLLLGYWVYFMLN